MECCFYEGFVRHRRFGAVPHDFRFPLCMVYLDLAELDTVFRGRWLWSTSRPAPLRPALIPLKPVKPNILLNLGLGFGFAVFGSLGLAFGLELFRDHFEKPYEVEAALGAPVLASIPHRQE